MNSFTYVCILSFVIILTSGVDDGDIADDNDDAGSDQDFAR